MRTCIYAGKSTLPIGTHAYSVQNWCFSAKYEEGAEITVGPELGALTLGVWGGVSQSTSRYDHLNRVYRKIV